MPRITYDQLKNNPNVLHDARGWNMHSSEVKMLLGLPAKAKLPAEGMKPIVIYGITVWVEPIKEGGNARHQHRVMAMCRTCGAKVSAGRLHQHKCKVKSIS